MLRGSNMKKLTIIIAVLLLSVSVCLAGQGHFSGYQVDDQFTTNRAAGAINGTTEEPGGPWGAGARAVIDTGGLMSISSGQLVIPLGITTQLLQWPLAVTRSPGRIIIAKTTITTGSDFYRIGFATTLGSTTGLKGGYIYGSNILYDVGSVPFYSIANATYYFTIIQKSVGCLILIKGGIYTNWTYLGLLSAESNATTYLSVSRTKDSNALTTNIDFVRTPAQRWLPAPLAYDAFTTVWGTTTGYAGDGLYGAGGGGVTWTTRQGTVSVSGGQAIATALDGSGRAIATVPVSTAYTYLKAALTKGTTGCGLVMHYTDSDNYQYCWHDGTNFKVIERLAGVETTKLTGAMAYAAGAKAVMVAEANNTIRAFYNNVLRGVDATFNTGLVAQNVGIIWFDTDSTVDDFAAYARGNENQYAFLDQFVP